jgi:hypothetical protein
MFDESSEFRLQRVLRVYLKTVLSDAETHSEQKYIVIIFVFFLIAQSYDER